MRIVPVLVRTTALLALGFGSSACGSEDGVDSAPSDADAPTSGGGVADKPQIVVTTNILGDVVSRAVGDVAAVEVIMPLGADPHGFAPSAREAVSMENADLLVTNGAGFEEGMLGIIANVGESGTRVFAFADHVELLEFDGVDHDHDHDGHDDEGPDDDEEGHHDEGSHDDEDGHHDEGSHDDEDVEEGHDDEGSHDDRDDHHHDGDDPHIWTDPSRIAAGVEALGNEVAMLVDVDADAIARQVDEYVIELNRLASDMEATLGAVAHDQRVLVTNHEVFRYFADRFDFEVVGAVVPSLTTNAEASASEIEELAELIEVERIPAIFAETTQSSQLADAVADLVGNDIDVVELFTESLGGDGSGAETYVGMMSSNAMLIADALS